jgi:hypothetical protein
LKQNICNAIGHCTDKPKTGLRVGEKISVMKYILIIMAVAISGIGKAQTRTQQDSILLENYLQSTSFSWVRDSSGFINTSTEAVDFTKSFVRWDTPQGYTVQVPVLCVAIVTVATGVEVGQLEVVEAADSFDLPRGITYHTIFRDFSYYDLNTRNGSVNMYDLNYDGYLMNTSIVVYGTLTSFTAYNMPDSIKQRHALPPGHFCDKNKNGNVTWGECYDCMMNACASDPQCVTLCFIGNRFGGQCSASVALACVFIAIKY